MRKTIQLIVGIMLLCVLETSSLACTIFSANNGTTTFAASNGDYSDPNTYIVFYPAENGKHGRMYVGWQQFWWQTGINDEGLFYASASTTYLETQNSSQKPQYLGYLMYKCMEECSTVEEVREVFSQYNLNFLRTMQLMISDATGASVIIEGDAIHMKQDYYQVVTNFRLSQTQPPYPCWRYNTAVSMFENTTTISPAFFVSVCNGTHNEGYTQFSVVYDLQQKIIYLYRQYNYNQVKIFHLVDEIQSGYHIYSIQSLFLTSNPPSQPSVPQGSITGTIKQNYTYSTSSIDVDGDEIFYLFDWGDGTQSRWVGSYSSGAICEATHTWIKKGNFTIKVKAKDASGAESPWSDPLPVTMPYTIKPLWQHFFEWLFQRFPYAFPFLRNLIEH